MRLQLTILTLFLVCSCGTTESDFDLLIRNLKKLDGGYTYDQIKQDAENCYTPDKNGDSLFYTPTVPILGVLPDNGEIVSIIHFEPGDDLYPILRTFDKKGRIIDQENIAYGYCAGWDCDFDKCEEGFKIIDKNTIVDILTLVTTPCDSLENKNSSLTKKQIRQKTLTVDNYGNISVSEKVE
jgi:hypothetical protein